MAYWSSIVGQAVASGIITPDFKSALGEKVCQFGSGTFLNVGPNKGLSTKYSVPLLICT